MTNEVGRDLHVLLCFLNGTSTKELTLAACDELLDTLSVAWHSRASDQTRKLLVAIQHWTNEVKAVTRELP